MIKNKVLILFATFVILIQGICYGFSDELFEFELPENYGKFIYEGVYAFADTNNKEKGITIVAKENSDIKKSVWDVEDSDLNTLTYAIADKDKIKEIDKRAKLGEEKAIMFYIEDGENFSEIYLVASNNYIYIITMIAPTKTELNSLDFRDFKDTFKLKDRTTNYKAIEIIILIVVVLVSFIIKTKKKNRQQVPMHNMGYRNF